MMFVYVCCWTFPIFACEIIFHSTFVASLAFHALGQTRGDEAAAGLDPVVDLAWYFCEVLHHVASCCHKRTKNYIWRFPEMGVA